VKKSISTARSSAATLRRRRFQLAAGRGNWQRLAFEKTG
jgi:hypothetical protein